MSSAIHIAAFESDVIFKVAEALRVPVLVLAMVALAVVLFELGSFAVELFNRRRRDFGRLRTVSDQARGALQERGDRAAARATLARVAWSAPMGRALSFLVSQWGLPEGEAMISKALADFDFGTLRRLERTRLLVRAGPALGLMGTLIPLSPALAGLAAGHVEELSENLRVAFSVTVIGLLIGGIAFGISLVRDRLYGQDLSDLEFVANRLTEVATPSAAVDGALVAAPAAASAALGPAAVPVTYEPRPEPVSPPVPEPVAPSPPEPVLPPVGPFTGAPAGVAAPPPIAYQPQR